MLQCVGVIEFSRFREAKHKARFNALLCLQPPHPKDIIPRRGLITGAKVVNYFELSKRRAIFLRFFDSANHRRALDKWRGISRGSAL